MVDIPVPCLGQHSKRREDDFHVGRVVNAINHPCTMRGNWEDEHPRSFEEVCHEWFEVRN